MADTSRNCYNISIHLKFCDLADRAKASLNLDRFYLGDKKASRQRSGQKVSLFNQLKQGLLPGNS